MPIQSNEDTSSSTQNLWFTTFQLKTKSDVLFLIIKVDEAAPLHGKSDTHKECVD